MARRARERHTAIAPRAPRCRSVPRSGGPATLLSSRRALFEDVELGAISEAESKGIEIRSVIEHDRRIFLDTRLILSALGNLVRNAVKYTAPGRVLEMRGQLANGCAVIEVEDHCGELAPGKVEEAFAPFVRLDSSLTGHQRSGQHDAGAATRDERSKTSRRWPAWSGAHRAFFSRMGAESNAVRGQGAGEPRAPCTAWVPSRMASRVRVGSRCPRLYEVRQRQVAASDAARRVQGRGDALSRPPRAR